jgi:RNA polymerase sigma-70 factor (ECF subfamily)
MDDVSLTPPVPDRIEQNPSAEDFPQDPQNDPSTWGRLLDEYRPYLLSIAQAELPRALAPRLGPSDLVQMTLAKGHFRGAEFRGRSREELARWLRQILLNHLVDASREHARESQRIPREAANVDHLPELGRLSPCGEALSREERERLEDALLRLPELYRSVILWRHSEDLSFVEIGRRLGRSDEAARKLWARGLQKLQHEMGFDGQR